MTRTRRILLNIIATYGRSLFALFCGIFTARWVLESLGAEDYGLYGVVGGLVVFVSFLNSSLASATSRYYAVSIGAAETSRNKFEALEECRQWFNTALAVHTVVPLFLIAIGYPVGSWAIRTFLTIPPGKVETCVWVFRFTCFSCLVGMINVPFMAMYNAKQYIAELTIYGYAMTTANLIFFYYMATHPQPWLLKYSMWCCAVSVFPQFLICLRAFYVFPECRIMRAYLFERKRIMNLAFFAGWNLVGQVTQLLRVQGVAILINRTFGPLVNAAMTLGNTIEAHTSSLAASLAGAFNPAIANAYGSGDGAFMRSMAFRACKFGCWLQLIFVVPLVAEIDQVLALWLKSPPPYTAFLCIVAILCHLINVSTQGHYAAFSASGQIKQYQMNMCWVNVLTLPAAIVVVYLGGRVYALGVTLVVAMIVLSIRRVYYARIYTGMSALNWVKNIVIPLAIVSVLSFLTACTPRLIMQEGFLRILVTTFVAELVLIPLSWLWVLDDKEREFIKNKFVHKISMLIG